MVTSGASVRHSSSRAPAAANWASSLGPPSASSRVRPRAASSRTARAGSTRVPSPHDDDQGAGLLGGGHAVGGGVGAGEDQGRGERLGEQRQGEVQVQGRADHRDGRGRGLSGGGAAGPEVLTGPSRPVTLLAYRFRAHDDRVREGPQYAEDPHVGVRGQRLRPAVVPGRAVQRGHHVRPQPRRAGPQLRIGVRVRETVQRGQVGRCGGSGGGRCREEALHGMQSGTTWGAPHGAGRGTQWH